MSRKKRKNGLIRRALAETGMKHLELAHLLGLSEATLSEKLEHELPLDEQIAIASRIRKEHLYGRT